jgi:hypothetical protein
MQEPAPLSERDLGVAGLSPSSDTGAVRRALGTPRSVDHHDYSGNDEVLHLTDWRYQGVTISFYEGGRFFCAAITGHSRATVRGLRTGDPLKRVLALYGKPDHIDERSAHYKYTAVGPHPSNWGMIIELRDSLVQRITLGVIGWVD